MAERVLVHDYKNLQEYELLFPEKIDVAERAWRVSFRFQRLELFDEEIRKALRSRTEADWGRIFELAKDADLSVPIREHNDWPDPSYLMGIPDDNGVGSAPRVLILVQEPVVIRGLGERLFH